LSACSLGRLADAVDLNCGCPQRWAMEEGIGASMLKNPQLVRGGTKL
jgi:tRNA-dihydrouridine synthase 4